MADDWIKWVKGFARKPKVLLTARLLGVTRQEAAVLWMEFWSWADAQTEDGWLPNVTPADVDAVVEHPGFAKVAASAQVAWLTFEKDGLILPEFLVHNGQSAKRRAQHQRRVAIARAAEKKRTVCAQMCASQAHNRRTREE